MKGAIIFFSGTSNTEFIAKIFKSEFQSKGMDCSLIDIRRKKKLNNEYDYFVFAAPIYFDMLPKYFIDWVSGNIHNGNKRRCMVVSTQASDMAAGAQELTNLLEDRGFEVLIQDFVKMPNNFYIVESNIMNKDDIIKLKEEARTKVAEVVVKFINEEKALKEVSIGSLSKGKLVNASLDDYTPQWAKDNLSINYEICVRCGKCAKNCPARNIKIGEQIIFKSDCILCQRCIHRCPVNAFLFKGKKIEQYKI